MNKINAMDIVFTGHHAEQLREHVHFAVARAVKDGQEMGLDCDVNISFWEQKMIEHDLPNPRKGADQKPS